MSAIDLNRRYDLAHLVRDLRLAARTIRSQTFEERCAVRDHLAASLHERLEPYAVEDVLGLDALEVWTDSLRRADASDVDLLQELLYGIDTLVRVHLWREAHMPLEPPEPRGPGDL